MFLRDEDIKALIKSGSITDVADMTSDPDGPKSPIQPCSLDLTIGKIFVPGTAPADAGGRDNPKEENHALGAGETVVVETAESFHLPNDIGGFGFPPTSVSKVGVLVTNLGHVDPGYDGTLRFTLVNMGREPYSLKKREPIYTMLLFKLENVPTKDFRSRNRGSKINQEYVGVSQEWLNSLSRDFLNIRKRAKKAAKESVTEELKSPYRTAIGTGIAAVLTLSGVITGIFFSFSSIDRLEKKFQDDMTNLSNEINVQCDIQGLQTEIKHIKEQLKNSAQTPGGEKE